MANSKEYLKGIIVINFELKTTKNKEVMNEYTLLIVTFFKFVCLLYIKAK
jgi:hypothetical protein